MTGGLEGHTARFSAFAGTFRIGSAQDVANVDLKIAHTMRVLENAEGLARAEGLTPEEAKGPLLAALYHDIGRFPQYQRYKTFRDADSEDHARLGVRTLARLGALKHEPTAVRRVVVGAVRLHNVRRLPQGLVPVLDRAVRLVRDADKLDIMRVMIGEYQADGMSNSVVGLGTVDDPERYTPEILGQAMGGSSVDSRGMVYVNDFLLLLVSWVYDLNLKPALDRVRELGYLRVIMESLPADPGIDALKGKVLADLGWDDF